MISYVALFRKSKDVNGESLKKEPPNVEMLKETILSVSENSSGLQFDPDSVKLECMCTF